MSAFRIQHIKDSNKQNNIARFNSKILLSDLNECNPAERQSLQSLQKLFAFQRPRLFILNVPGVYSEFNLMKAELFKYLFMCKNNLLLNIQQPVKTNKLL